MALLSSCPWTHFKVISNALKSEGMLTCSSQASNWGSTLFKEYYERGKKIMQKIEFFFWTQKIYAISFLSEGSWHRKWMLRNWSWANKDIPFHKGFCCLEIWFLYDEEQIPKILKCSTKGVGALDLEQAGALKAPVPGQPARWTVMDPGSLGSSTGKLAGNQTGFKTHLFSGGASWKFNSLHGHCFYFNELANSNEKQFNWDFSD